MRGRIIVIGSGIALLALADVGLSAATAAPGAPARAAIARQATAARPVIKTGPATAALITALSVNGTGTVTPIYQTGSTGLPVPVGSDPIAAAFTPNGKRAYIVNAGADSVTPITIDGSAATPAPAITVGGDPVDIAITPNGHTAFVVNNFAVHSGSHYRYYVTPINLSTNAADPRIRVGTSPIEIAITPNGKYAYVANTNAGTVTPIRITPRRALHAIKVQFAPEAIAITPNSKYAFVANNGAGSVTPILVSANRALAPIKVGSFPAAIAITPNGKFAFVTNNGSDTVSEIRISDLKVIRTITVAGHPDSVLITPNGKYAYTGSWNNQAISAHLKTVTVIKVSTGAVVAHITVGRGPVALGYSAFDHLVYVANYYSNTVTPISATTAGAAIHIGTSQKEPVFIAIDPKP